MVIRVSARSSSETRAFYNDLVDGRVSRGLLGKDRRFNPMAIPDKTSVKRHFSSVVKPFLSETDDVLDLGCGSGGFMIALAPLCRNVVGADITPRFVDMAREALLARLVTNATVELIPPGCLPYADGQFDVILMVDTIHHLENVANTMSEVRRVLRPDGKVLIFEPNKINPANWLMHRLDPNEHGLLRLGTLGKYRSLLIDHYEILALRYSGLLIGPDGRMTRLIADVVSSPRVTPILGWLSPKLFIAARKQA